MSEQTNDGFPMLFIRDGAVMANSRTVAEAFGKQHKDVLESVDNLLKANMAEFPAVLFREVSSEHPTVPGRLIRSYEMTRDGFTLLAMGFTGEKALRWKLKYIEAFNRMEAELRAGAGMNEARIGKIAADAAVAVMTAMLPDMLKGLIAARGGTFKHGKTPGELWRLFGFPPIKGGAQWFGNRLEEMGCAAEDGGHGELGVSRARLFDVDKSERWIKNGGRLIVERYLARRMGQGVFVFKKAGAKQ
jgi:Rha family phage regulatory protein